jgi:hypothetical protein
MNEHIDQGFLHRYFLENSSKRLHKWIHYFDIYERHFWAPRKKGAFQCFCGHEKAANLAA